MSEQKETLIEQGTEFKGSFASDCPVVVKGRVEGDISAPSLVVSKTGAVSGIVKVKELRSEGELAGEYEADAVHLSGTVKDKTVIRARSLEVKLNPERGRMEVVFGECELDVGDMPTKEDAVAEAKRIGAPPLEEPTVVPGDGLPLEKVLMPSASDGNDNNKSRKKTDKPTASDRPARKTDHPGKDSVPPPRI
jgi:cytoskeletal protein CcmA (bactofilin family)